MFELHHEKRYCVKEIWQMMGSSMPTLYVYVGMEEEMRWGKEDGF